MHLKWWSGTYLVKKILEHSSFWSAWSLLAERIFIGSLGWQEHHVMAKTQVTETHIGSGDGRLGKGRSRLSSAVLALFRLLPPANLRRSFTSHELHIWPKTHILATPTILQRKVLGLTPKLMGRQGIPGITMFATFCREEINLSAENQEQL